VRIAVFIKSTPFHKNFGGLETQNKVLCEGLVKRGHDVVVFSPQKDVAKSSQKQEGVSYYFVPCVYRLGFFSSRDPNNWFNKSFAAFKELHEKEPFDLVVSQSSAGIGVIQKKNDLNIKAVSICHGTILGELKTRLQNIRSLKSALKLPLDTLFVLRVYFGRQREFIRHSNKVIAVSSAVKKAVIAETFVPENKITVIHNALDESKFARFEKAEATDSNVIIIYVGRVVKSKGLFKLVEVLADSIFNDTALHIVGDGEDMASLKNKIKTLGIENRVLFLGRVPHDDVISKLFASDIFVLPSMRVEGFPMTLVEAMFAGLPIVASDIGGISDAVVNKKNGFLVPPGNADVLHTKLMLLVGDPVLQEVFGENGRLMAHEQFSLASMLDKYEKVFGEVLA